MLVHVVRGARQDRGCRLGVRFQLLEDRRQVVVDQERQPQLVEAAVGPVAADRVLLEGAEIREQGITSFEHPVGQFLLLLERLGPRRMQAEDPVDQVDRRPHLHKLIRLRQVTDMERVQPEDRAAHEDQHHSHDHAQSDDELEANGPPDHDDLPVVRAGSNSRGDPEDGSIRAAALLIPEVAAGLKPTLWGFS